jgi:hypothetical protein
MAISGRTTYQFVDIPTSMLASCFCFGHPLMDFEVPVHVSGFLLLAFFICLEAPATLCARGSQSLIQARYEMRSGSTDVNQEKFRNCMLDLHLEGGRFQNNIIRYIGKWRS